MSDHTLSEINFLHRHLQKGVKFRIIRQRREGDSRHALNAIYTCTASCSKHIMGDVLEVFIEHQLRSMLVGGRFYKIQLLKGQNYVTRSPKNRPRSRV